MINPIKSQAVVKTLSTSPKLSAPKKDIEEVLTNPQELASGEIPPEFLAKQKAYLAAKKGQNANNR